MSDKSQKPRLRDMVAADKKNMLPLNFAASYIGKPVYVVLAAILLILFGAFVDAGSFGGSVICLLLLALMTVALIYMKPFVRKRAVRAELERYDLKHMLEKRDRMASHKVWDFSTEELRVYFNRYGMGVGDERRYYNHMDKRVMTGNDYQRVGIFICFSDSEGQSILLPLNARVLKMLDDFQVTLDNQAALDYIFAHPEEAFTEIYSKGHVALK